MHSWLSISGRVLLIEAPRRIAQLTFPLVKEPSLEQNAGPVLTREQEAVNIGENRRFLSAVVRNACGVLVAIQSSTLLRQSPS